MTERMDSDNIRREVDAELTRIFAPGQPRPVGVASLLPLTSATQLLNYLRSVSAGVLFRELLFGAVTFRRLHPDAHPVPVGKPSSWRIAAALAERLDPVVPPPLRVVARAEFVDVLQGDDYWDGSSASVIVEDLDDRTDLERAETVANAVLSGVQDAVAHAIHLPWPRAAEANMALPFTRVAESSIELGFGDSDAPTLRLAPLRLEDFIEPSPAHRDDLEAAT
jgi:hypothetical protein